MNLNSSNIKLLMAEQELNIGLLAERMDMSRQWVSSNLQRGYSNTKFINKLAEALEVEIKDIVKLEDQKGVINAFRCESGNGNT